MRILLNSFLFLFIMEFQLFLKKIALENAVKFQGQANPKSLIGHVIQSYPEKKSDMKTLVQDIQSVVSTINNLSVEEQIRELDSLGGPSEKKNTRKEGLKELEDAQEGKVIMRFAPSPSGPLHIGHAIAGGLSSLYCKKYDGKFIFRIEDTNPDNIYEPAYELLKEDADWLFGNVSEYMIQSDRLEIYYAYAKQLLESGHLYVDDLSADESRELLQKQIAPPNKSLPAQEQLKLFEKMLQGGYKEGEAVVRWNGDLHDKNPAMRDFPLFRINDSPHPRQGTRYRVWPLMNFSVAIDDIESGMTHIIRGKDHADNAKRQEVIYKALNKPLPKTYFIGRVKFDDLEVSCSKTKVAIEEGKFSGWEDIRLPFIKPLALRGFVPQAFLQFTESLGMTQVDKRTTKSDFFATLESFNKDNIDATAKRFFFIQNPIEKSFDKLPQSVELDSHPNHKGGRPFTIQNSIYVESEDEPKFEKTVRLYDYVTIKNNAVIGTDYNSYKDDENKAGVIHWLPSDSTQIVTVEIVMPDASILSGIAEKHIESLQIGDIIQFERFGFCRLHSIIDGKRVFWFAHK